MATSPLMFNQNSIDANSSDQNTSIQDLLNQNNTPTQYQQDGSQPTSESAESAIPTSPVITPMMRAAMAFMQNNQSPNGASPIKTVNIGGHNILQTNSPGDNIARMNDTVSQGLNGIASQYINQKNMDNRQSFIQSIHQIMSTMAPQQDKMNALLDLQAAHGTDYGLGINSIASKLGVNKPAAASLQNPAQRIQQLLQMGQLDPDKAHQTAVQQLGANYATTNPELANSIQGTANKTVLDQANQVVQKQFGPGYEINPDWVTSGKGNMVQAKQTAVSNDPNYNTLAPTDALAQLKQQNPGYAAQLQMYADGRGGKLSASNRSPRVQQMVQDLAFLYPGIDIDNINQRVDTLKDFSSGKTSQNITAFNTALQHLNNINDLIPKLNNSPSGWFNSIAQPLESGTGIGNNPNVAAFNNTKTALSGELATAYKASGATQEEINQIQKGISSSSNPDNLKAAVQSSVQLLGGKLQALQAKWGNTYNSPGDLQGPGGKPIISPASQAIIQKLGGEGQSMSNTNDVFMQNAQKAGYTPEQIQQYLASKQNGAT